MRVLLSAVVLMAVASLACTSDSAPPEQATASPTPRNAAQQVSLTSTVAAPSPTACPTLAACPTSTACAADTACPPAPGCPEPVTCPTCPTCPEPVVCPNCPEPIVCPDCPVCSPYAPAPTCPQPPPCPDCGDDFPGQSLCELLDELDELQWVNLSTAFAVDCGLAPDCTLQCDLDSGFERDVDAVADFLRTSRPFDLSMWQLEHCVGSFYHP